MTYEEFKKENCPPFCARGHVAGLCRECIYNKLKDEISNLEKKCSDLKDENKLLKKRKAELSIPGRLEQERRMLALQSRRYGSVLGGVLSGLNKECFR